MVRGGKHLSKATLSRAASNGLRGEPPGPAGGCGLSHSAAAWGDEKPRRREGGVASARPSYGAEPDAKLDAVSRADIASQGGRGKSRPLPQPLSAFVQKRR